MSENFNFEFYKSRLENYQIKWLNEEFALGEDILDDPQLFTEKFATWKTWQRSAMCKLYAGISGKSVIEDLLYPELGEKVSYLTSDTDIEESYVPSSYLKVPEHCFSNCSLLKKVTISEGVECIGRSAFWNSGLTEINLPNSIKSIDKCAFHSTKIEELTIPSSVESVGDSSFAYTYNLKSLKIEGGVKVIPDGFCMFSGVKEVKLPNTCEVIRNKAFYECADLTSIEIPEGVTAIGEMAFMCTGLKELVIPKSVKYIENYIIGTWTSHHPTAGKCKIRIKGMSKEEGREWAEHNIIFANEATRKLIIGKII